MLKTMRRDLRETLHYSSKDEKSLKAKELWDLPENLKTQFENFSVGDAGFCHLKAVMDPRGSSCRQVWPVTMLFHPGDHMLQTANLTRIALKALGDFAITE